MPHHKRARRFKPYHGVSSETVQEEAKWLAWEFDNTLIGSISELRERLGEMQTGLIASDANVQLQIDSLPEREQLAIRSLLARDLFHLSVLYEQFFHAYDGLRHAISPAATERATAMAQTSPPPAPTAFKEWLFEL